MNAVRSRKTSCDEQSGPQSMRRTASFREGAFRRAAALVRSAALFAFAAFASNAALALTSTTTSLSASATSAVVGQSVTLTATVSPTASTGPVTFKDGTTTLGTGTLSAGHATLAITFTTTGSHSLTAVYAGDATYATSTSSAVTETITARTTTTSLTSSANPATVGQSTTLTATVIGTGPTGTVTFKDGSTTLGTGTVSSGVATFATSFTTTGAHSLTAVYGGDTANLTSTSSAVSETVNARSTTTALTSSVNPAAISQNTTLTATVSGTAPSGSVTFKDGAATLGTGTVSSGVATFVTSFVATGAHSLTAVYAGDANNLTSASAALSETVNARTTSTVLTSSVNPASVGQSTTLTATVTGTMPGGTVTFKDGTTTLGTGTIASGVASFSASFTTTGSHSLTAVYGGDSNNLTGTSAAVSETINARSTTTVLAASANPTSVGQSTTLTATVTGTNPTGTVTFKDGTTTLGTGAVSSGVATFAATFSTTGSHSLTAVYGGNSANLTSTSAALSETVNAATTAAALTSSINPSTLGQSTTLKATVTGASPTGAVTFKDGTTTLGTSNLSSGAATLATSFSAIGTHSLSAIYAGNATNLTSTSPTIAQTVNPVASTTGLTSSANPVNLGQSTVLTATVTGAGPTGTVTFMDGSTTLGTGTVVSGSATLGTTFSAPGTHSVTAVYAGDANNVASTSSALSQTVSGLSTGSYLTSSINPANLGQSVTLTATVSGTSPSGTVTFKDGSTTLGTGTLSGGVTTLSTSFASAGSHSLSVVYAGDANNLSSTSAALTQRINLQTTSTALSSSVNPATLGQNTTLTATLTGSSPTGAVTFKDGSAVLGAGTVNAGVATFATSFATGGTHVLTAVYAGDGNNLGSTSSALNEQLPTGATTTSVSLALSPTSVQVGQSFNLTANVSPSAATGTVAFMDGSAVVGTATLSSGLATLSASLSTIGSHSLVAIFEGNDAYARSTSNAVAKVISARTTTTVLTPSVNPATVGQSMTLSAAVAGTNPTGSASFKDGSNALGTAAVVAGVATLNTTFIDVYAHNLVATYLGDANNLGSASSTVNESVNSGPTSTVLSASANAVGLGEIVNFTAMVTGTNLTGNVTFKNGGSQLAVITPTAGVAKLATSFGSAGTNNITAYYAGDISNLSSNSAAQSVTARAVGSTPSAIALVATPSPATYSQTVTLTATVSPVASTGVVTFFVDGYPSGTGFLNAGIATFTTSMNLGTRSLLAVYAGDATYAVSTSASVTETITQAITSTKVSSSSSSIGTGQPVTLTATVTGGAYISGGAVTFKDGATTLGVAGVQAAQAGNLMGTYVGSLPASFSTTGSHSITATFGGNSNNMPSTSQAMVQTVTAGPSAAAVTSSVNPTTVGQSTTLTATVTGSNPTGTVTFKDGTTTLGTASLGGGVANLPASFGATGTHNVTAVYSGDTNNLSATSAAFGQGVAGGAAALTLSASATTIQAGLGSLTLTAKASGSYAVSNSMHFYDGATDLGSSPVDGTGSASLVVGNWPAGNHAVTAQLVNTNFSGVVSAPVTITGTAIAPTIVLTANRNPANPPPYNGDPIIITAAVSGAYLYSATDSMTISLRDGGAVIGTVCVGYCSGWSTTASTFTVSFLPTLSSGNHNLTATIDADRFNAATNSPVFAETIGMTTQMEFGVSNSPAKSGQTVGMSVSITGGSASPAPSGTVTFKDGATVVATATVSTRSASASYVVAGSGTHVLTANYSGDGGSTNLPSSTSFPLTVLDNVTAVTLSSSVATVAVSAPIALKATVDVTGATGTVTFSDEAGPLGTAALSGGSATLNTSLTTSGPHRLVASYSGDSNNGPDVSNFVTVQVGTSGTPASPGNMTWLYGYDAVGSLITAIDPNANATQKFYDSLQRNGALVQPLQAVGGTTPQIQFGYDGQDNLTSVKDPRNLTTSYTLNGFGSTTAVASPDTGSTGSTYDAVGNLKTRTDARGSTATFTYDALNRVKSISYSTGASTSYEYDGGSVPVATSIGKLSKVTDESGNTAYTYDGFGNVATKTSTIVSAAGTKSFTVTYTWGTTGPATGKLVAIKYPSGSVVNYAYDATERLSAITANPVNANGVGASGTALPILSALTYNGNNAISGWTWRDGTVYQRTYDAFGRLISYPLGKPTGTGAAAGLSRTLGYDNGGRIVGYTHTNSGAAQPNFDQTFGYDGLDRLAQDTMASASYTYSYDQTGNRTSRVVAAKTYANAVSTTSNQLTSVQSSGTGGSVVTNSYQFDPAGNVSSDGSATYAYGTRGRMSSATLSGGTVSYLYNGLDQRASKTGPIALIASGASYFAYDEAGHLLGEYDANLNPIYETVYVGSMPVAALKQTGSAASSNLTTAAYNVWADHIATPRVVTRAADQAIVWRWDAAEAFGATAPDQNPNALGAFTFNQRFPGQVFDSETGLLQNGYRYYDAPTGRYKSFDPIGLAGGVNGYAYVGGNPISNIDPLGLMGVGSGVYGTGPRTPVGPAPSVTVNVGIGFSGMLGTSGKSTEYGVVGDSSGKVCVYRQSCGISGLGAYLGAGGAAGVQGGLLGAQTSNSAGVCAMGGNGLATDIQILADPSGNLSGAKGIPRTGFGIGGAGGAMSCTTQLLSCN